MKKFAVVLLIPLLALGMFTLFTFRPVNSQTEPETETSAPTAPAQDDTSEVKNRPVARWITTNMVMLKSLINDSKQLEHYLSNEQLGYAEEACPQLVCGIATMRGQSPPADALAASRCLKPVCSGFKCPPIPDAQAAADLNTGLAQLETAINHLITGINTSNGELIRGAEPEVIAANETFDKVLEDLSNVAAVESGSRIYNASPVETVQSFFDAVQAGDTDFVSELTGGMETEMAWCAKDLVGYIGYASFGDWVYVVTHQNDTNACVHVDSFMTLTDPAALPSTRNITHYYIDGEFKLENKGGGWVIVSLPNYQEARNDGPYKWGSSPYNYPYPGDAI